MSEQGEAQELATMLMLHSLGYDPVRRLPTGEWAGITPYLYTWGLVVGLDPYGWRTRFCFESREEASEALSTWSGEGWPPGYWIKQKPEDITNPAWEEKHAQRL